MTRARSPGKGWRDASNIIVEDGVWMLGGHPHMLSKTSFYKSTIVMKTWIPPPSPTNLSFYLLSTFIFLTQRNSEKTIN